MHATMAQRATPPLAPPWAGRLSAMAKPRTNPCTTERPAGRIRAEHMDFDPAETVPTPRRQSPDGIVVHRDGRVVYANATALRWVGAQYSDQVRGHPFTEFIHADPVEPATTPTRMAALRQRSGDVTRASESDVLQRLDGTTMNVEGVTGPDHLGGRHRPTT